MEEILEQLKNHLSVQVKCDKERGYVTYVEVHLFWNDKEISSDFD